MQEKSMANAGSFISEVYRDGRVYYFEANFTVRQWKAVIWDEQGRPCGSISCASPASHLEGDALEDAVCEWVHRAVQHEVGFVADSQRGLRLVDVEPIVASRNAANAEQFDSGGDGADAYALWDMVDALTARSRSVVSRVQNAPGLARFLQRSDPYRMDRPGLPLTPVLQANTPPTSPLVASSREASPPPG
ncbi:hypothetical protein [Xylophilus sp. GOD-11R]|uniref:hypothetical protein n=1 Tax=Xylophilus sp. GOD-11R TaxID=3089814 RepID=UPI00298C076B|nr:hypothetical protein [Xylophilus sp. GOD-11R]WPB59012.1 hypothetical protein R9X41_10380 [Xylophilus sp. GOD-11R]